MEHFHGWTLSNVGFSAAQVRLTSAARPLPHAAPSCPSTHAASFSSAASPSVSGKPGGPGGSTDDAATVASSEDKAKPIQPPFTGDAKGGTGQLDQSYYSKCCFFQ
jgi:hypothetical protein